MNFTNFATRYMRNPFGGESEPSKNSLAVPNQPRLSSSTSSSSASLSSAFSDSAESSMFDVFDSDSELYEYRALQSQIQNVRDALHSDPANTELLKAESFNDWMIERFLKKSDFCLDTAAAEIIKTLKWRHESMIDKNFAFRGKEFCREFYEFAGMDFVGTVPETNEFVVWLTSRYSFNRLDYLDEYIKDFVDHQLEVLDRQSGRHGAILVIDCKHLCRGSVNLELFKHTLQRISAHYPQLFRSILIVNLGLIWRSLAAFLMSWLTGELKDIVSLIHLKQLTEHMPEQFVYEEYGGRRPFQLHVPTERTFHQVHWFQALNDKQQTQVQNALALAIN